ncbi:hypothetical protein [Kocuria arenosa]|uniref:hypothetical protein n=1 Tax=Kocuria arenosa TaxID=3071446 RepID=UPI0034D4D500
MTTIAAEQTGNHDVRTRPETGAAPPAPGMTPGPGQTPGSRLGPTEDFPEDLTGLCMAELQVLHSRITRQLDHDYLTDPAGPHTWTVDRSFELAAELDARDTA